MFPQLTCSVQLKTAWKSELSYKNRCFFLVCNLRPSNNSSQLIFNIKAVVLIVIICPGLCFYPEFRSSGLEFGERIRPDPGLEFDFGVRRKDLA